MSKLFFHLDVELRYFLFRVWAGSNQWQNVDCAVFSLDGKVINQTTAAKRWFF